MVPEAFCLPPLPLNSMLARYSRTSSQINDRMAKLHNKARWHRMARYQLRKEPLCAICLAEGRVVAARVTDHIKPHHNDPTKFWFGKLQLPVHALPRKQKAVRGEPRLRPHDRNRWLAN